MSAAVERCDVCIVGAGIAGLNALFTTSQYLSPGQRVILLDRRQRVGGMWVDTYEYVRLHQPHPFFTAGNISWTLGAEPSHLATKHEVLAHFDHCLDVLRRRVKVDEYYGWTMQSDEEADGVVRVQCRSDDGRSMVLEAKRLIKAIASDVEPNDPLPLSSTSVHSVSPNYCDMRSGDIDASDAPVWVIGSGKTAMDTAHALINRHPGREVNLLAGSGTYFAHRDRLFPTGGRRWWGGLTFNAFADEVTQMFDGTNEEEVARHWRARCGVWVTPSTGNFLLGVLSTAERDAIAAGLHDIVMDHLVDVVDRDGRAEMQLRSGAVREIDPGSWIVNCTGYLLKHSPPYEPYTSPSGRVLSLNARAATLHLTTYMGYFLPHLMFTDQLTEVPLYELDLIDLRRKCNAVFPHTLMTLAVYNLSLIADALPLSVFRDCGLDVARWYPVPRQAVGMAQFLATHRRRRPHLQRTLDTVAKRFDVHCGPLARSNAPLLSQ
ncbi:MAG: potassium transporter [Mycolicibacterium sp.]|uniref:NAD(P)-binding protein n=1 Tax=Mycolicibacterium sp. TaxID=2320850 RepID=UPI00092A7441|nr:NAD(P)-binding protein [Mycolicibacterium sp.]RUP34903.1 MAG: potassium transporter [Mycolicibacterium sp.]SHU73085.1 putative flavoprotein involved in K+ transport [Mycobacteroides abscessus subsp. abscessus]